MKVCVFGLGYVGTVMMGCLAREGHSVVGVDLKREKVDLLEAGESPVVDPGLGELIAAGRSAGLLRATDDPREAVAATEMSFICVGTPAARDGRVDTTAVQDVCGQIGAALREVDAERPHTVVIRSTVMPGTVSRCRQRLADASGGEQGGAFTLCINPEFLREGSAVADFMSPPFTVIGADDEAWAEPLRRMYGFLEAPLFVTEPGVAEVLKMVCNAWHATKVCFANEVGRLCGDNGIDPHAVMDLFVRDDKLNLSGTYLRPGFVYGGSCLPKDVMALVHFARRSQLELPLLEGVPRSNALHGERAKDAILSTGCRRIGFLGLSFKRGTDDLRGSPLVDLVEFCLGKGLVVRVFDPSVVPSRLVGRNREVALQRLGHLADVLVSDVEDLVSRTDLLVLGHHDESFLELCERLPASKRVLDLTGMLRGRTLACRCEGLCW